MFGDASGLECKMATPAGTARAESPAGAQRRGDWSRARGKRPSGTESHGLKKRQGGFCASLAESIWLEPKDNTLVKQSLKFR